VARRAAPEATLRLKKDSSAVHFGVGEDGFLRRVPDGSMRLVSQSGGVTLLPAPASHVHIQGSVRIGSSDTTCDDERRGLVRFSLGTGTGGDDELLVCAGSGSQPSWRAVAVK
jgi:hypothetical protein